MRGASGPRNWLHGPLEEARRRQFGANGAQKGLQARLNLRFDRAERKQFAEICQRSGTKLSERACAPVLREKPGVPALNGPSWGPSQLCHASEWSSNRSRAFKPRSRTFALRGRAVACRPPVLLPYVSPTSRMQPPADGERRRAPLGSRTAVRYTYPYIPRERGITWI